MIGFICFLMSGSLHAGQADPVYPQLKWVKEVGARKVPKDKKTYSANSYGAVNDGRTLNTKSIQAAIDACSEKGGGRVVFEPGSYVTGSLFIRKGVNLCLGEKVTLLGSQDIADYPEMDTRIAGVEMKWPTALINFVGQERAALTGKGTIHARGKPFWDKYWRMRRDYEARGLRWIVDYDCKRPRTLLVQNSTDITVSGLTLKQAGFWTIQILYSDHVTIDGAVIQNNVEGSGPSTDGIDIDSSTRILVQNCDIDCNDDDFCLKAGRDADGLRVNKPTEFVVIRKCIARKGAGLITCGSETSGGIRNILAYDLVANGTSNCINLKSAVTRGGMVENIYVHDIEMNNVGRMLTATMNWNPTYSYSTLPEGIKYDTIPHHWKVFLEKVPPEKGIPRFRNVFLTGFRGTVSGPAVSIAGMKESPVENCILSDIQIQARSKGDISFAEGCRFNRVSITTRDQAPLRIRDCTDMQCDVTEGNNQ